MRSSWVLGYQMSKYQNINLILANSQVREQRMKPKLTLHNCHLDEGTDTFEKSANLKKTETDESEILRSKLECIH